uniref:Uncharacterized protein n=2 Tax=Timema TaxID=61471 RepID=A0A7R9DEN9_TIMPO|nr:unnamed protein product [Timema douglasi]CAD7413352.1 unnamed protein product [Timema poppensis]
MDGTRCTDVRRSALHKERKREICMRRLNQNNTMRRELARGNPPSHRPSRTKDRAANRPRYKCRTRTEITSMSTVSAQDGATQS